jgi:hypothetical protein
MAKRSKSEIAAASREAIQRRIKEQEEKRQAIPKEKQPEPIWNASLVSLGTKILDATRSGKVAKNGKS